MTPEEGADVSTPTVCCLSQCDDDYYATLEEWFPEGGPLGERWVRLDLCQYHYDQIMR